MSCSSFFIQTGDVWDITRMEPIAFRFFHKIEAEFLGGFLPAVREPSPPVFVRISKEDPGAGGCMFCFGMSLLYGRLKTTEEERPRVWKGGSK